MIKAILKWTMLVVCSLAIGVGYAVLVAENVQAVPCDCPCGTIYLDFAPECPYGCGFFYSATCQRQLDGNCSGVCNTNRVFMGCAEEPGIC